MPSAFATSEAKTLDRVFARYAVPAGYLSPEFVTTNCSIILNQADDVATLGNMPIVAGQTIAEVRVAELAAPSKGGVFTADDREYRIVSAPKRNDPSALVWTCLCDLQPSAP